MSFCTLTLAFLCLLHGLPLPTTPLNRIFSLAIPYHSRKFNCLPLCNRMFLSATRCTQVLKTYCQTQHCAVILQNFLLLFFQVTKCYGERLLWYRDPLQDVISKMLLFIVASACCKATGKSNSQNYNRKYQYSGNFGKTVVLYCQLKYGHNGYVLILLEMD